MSKVIVTVPNGISIDVLGGGRSIELMLLNQVHHAPLYVIKAGVKGDKGDAGGIGYTHTQSTPMATWTINHNLGLKPHVQLLSVGGIEFDGEVVHTSINQIVIYFSTAISGIAQLRV